MIIVDDCVSNCRILNEFCKANGFEVLAILNSSENVVAEYERRKPDVIIMDYLMPEKDGITTTKELTAKYPDAKVVLFSAVGFWDTQAHAKDSGAVGYIQKPFYIELMNFIKGLEI